MRAIRPVIYFLASGAAAIAAEPTASTTATTVASAVGTPVASAGGAAGAASARATTAETRAAVPGIFAPKQGGGARDAAGAGRSGASKKLRELLERPASGRAISPEMATKLGEVTQRAAPPAKAETGAPRVTAGATLGVEAGDAVLLDPVYVEGMKPPAMKEREMLTPAGKLAEARRRRPGLSAGIIPLGNDKLALELLEDDFRRERLEEERELRGLMKIDGREVRGAVKKQIDAGAAQRPGWIDEKGTRFREPR